MIQYLQAGVKDLRLLQIFRKLNANGHRQNIAPLNLIDKLTIIELKEKEGE